MPKFKSIRDLSLAGKRVFMRVDFNVPQDKATGAITNNQRIVAALPTIKYALEQGASVVLAMSHLGRPDGKKIAKFSLKPVAAELEKLLGKPVAFLDDCVGPAVEAACAKLAPGSVVLLENLRFHIEEEGKVKEKQADGTEKSIKADPQAVTAFRASLSKLATSTSTTPSAPPTARTARWSAWQCQGQGRRLPDGGRAEGLCQGHRDAGPPAARHPRRREDRRQDSPHQQPAREVRRDHHRRRHVLHVQEGPRGHGHRQLALRRRGREDRPGALRQGQGARREDHSAGGLHHRRPFPGIARRHRGGAGGRGRRQSGIPDGWMGLDAGPKSRELFAEAIGRAKTIIWNGPPGVFEFEKFAEGTKAMAAAFAEATARGAPRWSAAATPPRRPRSARSSTRSPIAPPAAAPASSSSKARRSRASRFWKPDGFQKRGIRSENRRITSRFFYSLPATRCSLLSSPCSERKSSLVTGR
jgi:phosphoglycerate kinase